MRESLVLLSLLKVIECILLLGVFNDSLLFLLFLEGDLSLNSKELFVGKLEFFLGLLNSLESLNLFSLLLFELLLGLTLDELTFELIFLHSFDVRVLEIIKLI